MKESKEELLKKAVELSKKYDIKKNIVNQILDDLDKETKVSNNHIKGISTINELVKEMEELELEHSKTLEEIKKN